MTIIYAATEDQHLIATVLPRLAQSNVNTVRLHVDFDSPWDAYPVKSAVFTTSRSVRPYPVSISSGGDCLIPAEVLAEECQLYITVRGENSATGATKSSTRLKVKVLGGQPAVIIADPTPGVYSVLSSRMSALEAAGTVEGSEVIGIRTGADGTVYPTAADAVLGQMNLLQTAYSKHSDLVKSLIKGESARDLLEGHVWSEDTGLNSNNGKILANNASGYRCITDFISVLPNTEYYAPEGAIACEYNLFGVFLAGHAEAFPSFTTTEDTAYVLYAHRPNNITPYLRCGALSIVKKRLSILGDSYSTYGDFVTPPTNRCFYNGENEEEDTTDVSDIWWYKLIQDKGYLLEVNNSYSGSPVCNTGYNGADASAFSFLGRMSNIGNPDVIAVFGGTNDSWANVPIGSYKYNNWTTDDLKTFRPAFAYMCEYLTKHHPNAEIYIVINSGLSTDISASMTTIAEHYDLSYRVLPTFEKPYGGHPGRAGQLSIYEAVKPMFG